MNKSRSFPHTCIVLRYDSLVLRATATRGMYESDFFFVEKQDSVTRPTGKAKMQIEVQTNGPEKESEIAKAGETAINEQLD